MRFGQFLATVGTLGEDDTGRSLWDIEDEELAVALERFARDLSPRQSALNLGCYGPAVRAAEPVARRLCLRASVIGSTPRPRPRAIRGGHYGARKIHSRRCFFRRAMMRGAIAGCPGIVPAT